MTEQQAHHSITAADRMLPNPHVTTVPDEEARHLSDVDMSALQLEFNAWQEGKGPVTELGRSTLRLVQEARDNVTDARSGLLSPKGMEQWFERKKPEQFMILMCDGRGFGQVNKTYDHIMGNKVIEYMGMKIDEKLRTQPSHQSDNERRSSNTDAVSVVSHTEQTSDAGGSRWGGDEFYAVIDLTGLTEEEVAQARVSILERFTDFGTFQDGSVRIPVSVRTATIIGKKSDNKTFADYQAEVSKELQKITDVEKDILSIESSHELETLDPALKEKIQYANKTMEVISSGNLFNKLGEFMSSNETRMIGEAMVGSFEQFAQSEHQPIVNRIKELFVEEHMTAEALRELGKTEEGKTSQEYKQLAVKMQYLRHDKAREAEKKLLATQAFSFMSAKLPPNHNKLELIV